MSLLVQNLLRGMFIQILILKNRLLKKKKKFLDKSEKFLLENVTF